mmetsp:Transcript_18172/g.42483  ORF Transcript_18172/g.42483 Transcript_18172/m.42483 type:complete len:281 (-) Transcript_18172:193-1035(-)
MGQSAPVPACKQTCCARQPDKIENTVKIDMEKVILQATTERQAEELDNQRHRVEELEHALEEEHRRHLTRSGSRADEAVGTGTGEDEDLNNTNGPSDGERLLQQQLEEQRLQLLEKERQAQELLAERERKQLEEQATLEKQKGQLERERVLKAQKLQEDWWLSREDFKPFLVYQLKLRGEVHQVAVSHADHTWEVVSDEVSIQKVKHDKGVFHHDKCAVAFRIQSVSGEQVDAIWSATWNLSSMSWKYSMKVNNVVVPAAWTREKDLRMRATPPEVLELA